MSGGGAALPRARLIGLPTDAHSSFLRGAAQGPDIVELDPPRDVNGVTATLAARLVRELASLVPGAKP